MPSATRKRRRADRPPVLPFGFRDAALRAALRLGRGAGAASVSGAAGSSLLRGVGLIQVSYRKVRPVHLTSPIMGASGDQSRVG